MGVLFTSRFRCFCLILKVWIIASFFSEQAALYDAGSRSSFIVTNLWQPKILFILLHFASYAEQYTMQCCPGLKGEITNSNWHLKRFPDEREGDNQNIFWCELPTGTELTLTDTRMTEWGAGAVMGSPTIITVLTINAFSACAICNSVLWKSFCFFHDAGNWSQKCRYFMGERC